MTTASSKRLEDAIMASTAAIDRWAAQQKAIADQMVAEATEHFAAFEKRIEASHERLAALQTQRGLKIGDDDQTNQDIEKFKSEIQLRMSDHEELEAILVEKKTDIDCKIISNSKQKYGSQTAFSIGRGTGKARSSRQAANGRKRNE